MSNDYKASGEFRERGRDSQEDAGLRHISKFTWARPCSEGCRSITLGPSSSTAADPYFVPRQTLGDIFPHALGARSVTPTLSVAGAANNHMRRAGHPSAAVQFVRFCTKPQGRGGQHTREALSACGHTEALLGNTSQPGPPKAGEP